jgi:hypothetical protein
MSDDPRPGCHPAVLLEAWVQFALGLAAALMHGILSAPFRAFASQPGPDKEHPEALEDTRESLD